MIRRLQGTFSCATLIAHKGLFVIMLPHAPVLRQLQLASGVPGLPCLSRAGLAACALVPMILRGSKWSVEMSYWAAAALPSFARFC